MDTKQISEVCHRMTLPVIDDYLRYEKENGASDNMMRRYKGAVNSLFDYLTEDKTVTKDQLLGWRKSMEDNGYAMITVQNYVKCINRYLEYAGCSTLRFPRGKAKDIAGMTFGYLTAVEPTEARSRGDVVWTFKCKCGNTVELAATRVISGNTLSCGCLKGAHLKKVNKYFDGTSLMQSITEKVESTRSSSGYVGVSQKRGKWQAYITYKRVHYFLGCYQDLDDAVKARARAKELVAADAKGLLDFYEELEKSLPAPSDKKKDNNKGDANEKGSANSVSIPSVKQSIATG